MTQTSRADVPGLACRRIATEILANVLVRHRPLDEQLDGPQAHVGIQGLSERDRALLRKLLSSSLRRLGTLRGLLQRLLERGLPPNPIVQSALLIGATQIVLLDIPDHAAVDLAVRVVQSEPRAARYAGLVNAVLRALARQGAGLIAELDPVALDTPAWLMQRWVASYGVSSARAMAALHAHEPALDVTAKSDPAVWAERLGGRVVLSTSVRTLAAGPIPKLPGFAEGAWWVQDAGAAIPVRLFGELRGRSVLDVCAAPGGKTAQLALAGADVTAIDRSPTRVARMEDNLSRLGLGARMVTEDALAWGGAGRFERVLVDAPCLATGIIRRHPDIAWLKRPADLDGLRRLQHRLLDQAVHLLTPGGVLIYCTCSLEPEENEHLIAELLAREPSLFRVPIAEQELEHHGEFVTSLGDLRTLPCQLADPNPELAGIGGFYATRLARSA